MISQFVALVVLLGAAHQGMAACQYKPPMANYNANLMPGKFYLIILKLGFDIQTNQLHCGTEYIRSAVPATFPFYMSYQGSDGNVTNAVLNMTNLSPPGRVRVGAGAVTFEVSIIGAIKNRLNIFYGCNAQNGKEAVWVYYYKRVNGANEMNDASLQYIFDILAQNRISVYGFKTVDNRNCTN